MQSCGSIRIAVDPDRQALSASMDGVGGASDKALGVVAGATGRRHQVLAEAISVASESVVAVGMGVDARLGAFVASSTAVQI
jgi:hypothetical protein